MRNGRFRYSKVIDFGTNRKRVCNFLLVINMVTVVLSCAVSEILNTDPTPIPPEFSGCSPWTRLPTLWLPWSVVRKLIIRVINFELVQPIRLRYTNVTERDGQTDRRLSTAIPRFALRASRGKKSKCALFLTVRLWCVCNRCPSRNWSATQLNCVASRASSLRRNYFDDVDVHAMQR